MGLFWGSFRGFIWEKCLIEMAFCQKEVSKGLNHLMHAILVGREREPSILIHSGKAKRGRGKNKTRSYVME